MHGTLRTFYQSLFKHTKETGSIAPSSRFLADAITRHIPFGDSPLTILEVGPGTGPFTQVLVKKMGDEDHLHLCEVNPAFVECLTNRIATDTVWQRHRDRIHIHPISAQALEEEQRYDYIVSGLPFNNFEPAIVRDILSVYTRLIKPEGVLSFFEYAWVRVFRKLMSSAAHRKRVDAVGQVLQEFLTEFEEQRTFVGLNFPPSYVHVCQIPHPFK